MCRSSSSCLNSCHRRRVLTYHSHNIPVQLSSSASSFIKLFIPPPFGLSDLLRPKMFVIISLLFCWNLRNSIALASISSIQNSRYDNLPSFQQRQQPFSYSRAVGVSSHPNRNHHNNHRHPSQSQLAMEEILPITLGEETALQIIDPVLRSPSKAAIYPVEEKRQSQSQQSIYNNDGETIEPKRKKACGSGGEPSPATRSQLKRSYFAFTQDEVDEKVRSDEYRQQSERRKREVQHRQIVTLLQNSKRTESTNTNNAAGGADTADNSDGGNGTGNSSGSPLPWTCETKYEWKDLGVNHYPRFVRTAECTTRLCFQGFFRCRPRRYKTKVLKRVTPTDSASCEEDDVSLPESLRPGWKFVTVTINLCCDCSGRLPGSPL